MRGTGAAAPIVQRSRHRGATAADRSCIAGKVVVEEDMPTAAGDRDADSGILEVEIVDGDRAAGDGQAGAAGLSQNWSAGALQGQVLVDGDGFGVGPGRYIHRAAGSSQENAILNLRADGADLIDVDCRRVGPA